MLPASTPGYVKLAAGIFLALSLETGHAGDFATVGNARTEITIDKKRTEDCSEYVNFVEKFTRFTVFKYDWSAKKNYLIRQDFELGQGCFEGYNPAKVTVTANALDAIKGTVETKAEWQFSANGVFGGIAGYPLENLYKVELPGCCASTPVDKYYSLVTGSFIMASTIRPLKLSLVEQRSERYVAVEDNTAADRWNNAKNMATIFFGNRRDNLQMISVRSSDAKLNREPWDVTQLKFAGPKVQNEPGASDQTHTIFKSPETADLSLQIVLVCRCDDTELIISIPLQPDRLDIQHATIHGLDSVSLDYLTMPHGTAQTVAPAMP